MPVVDGGLLPPPPRRRWRFGSASCVPLLIGTTRDESAFFTVGDPDLSSLDEDGLRRWTGRLTTEEGAGDQLIASVRAARSARGEPVSPRDLWVAISHRIRLPTADRPVRRRPRRSVGARGGHLLLSVHVGVAGIRRGARLVSRPGHPVRVRDGPPSRRCRRSRVEAPTHSPFPPPYAGHGRDSPAPVPRETGPVGTPRPIRPRCSGPGPAGAGMEHRVDRPRHEELEAMAELVAARSGI